MVLDLGSAVEAKGNVWYQAGSRTGRDGKLFVEECRLDFRSDPRKATEGAVTIRARWRDVAESKAESFESEAKFKSDPPTERVPFFKVKFTPADGKEPPRRLPQFQIRGTGGATAIWIHDLDRKTLHPASAAAPQPELPAAPERVQPPKKP